MQRPQANEYNPYFQGYIDLVDEEDFNEVYRNNTPDIEDFFSDLPEKKHNYRYAPGKWTIKEVLMHIIDTERAMAYRAFVIARGDTSTTLYSMDQDIYARNVDVSARSIDSLIDEFVAVRNANGFLFENLSDRQSQLQSTVAGHIITPRALGYIIIGHALHHKNIITQRY